MSSDGERKRKRAALCPADRRRLNADLRKVRDYLQQRAALTMRLDERVDDDRQKLLNYFSWVCQPEDGIPQGRDSRGLLVETKKLEARVRYWWDQACVFSAKTRGHEWREDILKPEPTMPEGADVGAWERERLYQKLDAACRDALVRVLASK